GPTDGPSHCDSPLNRAEGVDDSASLIGSFPGSDEAIESGLNLTRRAVKLEPLGSEVKIKLSSGKAEKR
ncbi:MAG: hypothetical protein ACPG4A_11965, partial [Pseudomonadales bacterium]